MKIGEIVKIRDYSFAREIASNGLKSIHDTQYAGERGSEWRVVAIELELPGEVFLSEKHTNDTIIQNIKCPDRIVFIKGHYLNPLVCPTCNRTM